MRFISTNIHGFFDYLVGVLLIAMPWLMGVAAIGGPETWLPVFIGASIIVYSLATDYELGVFKKLHMRAHLILDGLAGGTLLLSIVFFGFFDVTLWWPYVILSLLLLVAAFFTRKEPRSDRPRFWPREIRQPQTRGV